MSKRSLTSVLSLMLAAAALTGPVPAAQAQVTVVDPWNLVQTAATAARTLEQITNQVKQITNQIKSLENEAKNLTRLGERFTPALVRQLRELDQLMDEAGGIALQVQDTRDALETLFKGDYAGTEFGERAQAAVRQIDASRAALRSSLMLQAKASEQLRSDQATLERLSSASANAEGALSAAQATNEILAFQAEQSMRLQSLLIAENRSQAIARAREMEAQAQGRAQSAYFFANARTAHPDAKPWN